MGRVYRADLDAIKGLAIIAVVFYHMGLLNSGYLGVDAFFVINGFFIIPSMIKLFESNSLSTGKELFLFCEKRLMRLWPLILIATSFCLLVGYIGMLPDDYENLSESVIASNLFSENILSAITTKNYWDISNDYKPLMHMWYVGVLVEFYLITPLLLWCTAKIANGIKLSYVKALKFVVILLTLLSFFYYLSPLSSGPGRFYFLPSRFWEIALGGIVAFYIDDIRYKELINRKVLNTLFTILFLGLLCLGLFWPTFMPIPALLLTAFTTAYLLCANPAKSLFSNTLNWKPLCFLGRMSFSVFVWHQILLAFYRYYYSDNITIVFSVLFWIATLGISYLSYIYVEQKVKVTHRTFVVTAVLMLAILLPSIAIYYHAGVVRDVPEMNIYFDDVHKGMHAEYVDRVYKMDKDFTNDGRIKVLVVGDSFARDWVNVLLESSINDSLDITYAFSYSERLIPRIKECDLLFSRGLKAAIPEYVWSAIKERKVWGIGTKTFGNSNGIIYARRHKANYFETSIIPKQKFVDQRETERYQWKDHYVDMMSPCMNSDGSVRVFTPSNKYISQDCTHLTEDGAKYYAEQINFLRIFKSTE